MAKVKPAPKRRKVALALQGGGSHGAFTWGVLDRLLEDETIDIIGVTGTSAGAMNAICLANGLARGGPQEARRDLRTFWEAVGKMPGLGSLFWWLPGETWHICMSRRRRPTWRWRRSGGTSRQTSSIRAARTHYATS